MEKKICLHNDTHARG